MKIFILVLLIFISNAQAYRYTKETCLKDAMHVLVKQMKGIFKNLTVDPEKVFLRIYNKANPDGILLSKENFKLIRPDRETKFLASGWSEGHDVEWLTELKDEYLKSTSHNIIIYDYDEYAYVPYFYANRMAKNVGVALGDFIVDIVKTINLNLKKSHIIGHSLGSHVVGFAGKQIFHRLNRKVARITSLDAAGPLFVLVGPNNRISLNDAEFVDAIHTNDHVLGLDDAYATADIYIDNAVLQPDCIEPTRFLKKDGLSCAFARNYLGCSHMKSHVIWMDSITSDEARAVSESSREVIIVGEHCPTSAKGVYHSCSEEDDRSGGPCSRTVLAKLSVLASNAFFAPFNVMYSMFSNDK